jgi:Predicted membrane protein (DUF2079)
VAVRHLPSRYRRSHTPADIAGPFSPLRPEYLFALLLPLAFLPLASRYVIFAVPGLAEMLLSHEAITLQLSTHYTATWIGYVLCAFVDGVSRVHSQSMFDGEEYLVFDHFTDPGYWIAADRPTIQRLIGSGAYTRIYDGAGIVILERKRPGFST